MMGTIGLLFLLLPLAAPLIAQDPARKTETTIETIFCEFYNKTCAISDEGCPPTELCNISEEKTKTMCFVAWKNSTEEGIEISHKGCLAYDVSCQNNKCVSYASNESHRMRNKVLYCCCHGNNCNINFSWEPREDATTDIPPKAISTRKGMLPAISATVAVLICILFIVPIVFYCYRRQKMANFVELPTIDSTGINQSCPSPNAIKRPIQLLEIKARGRFGGVWKAQYGSKTVAVKIFPVQDQQSWMVEKQIYSLPQMNHEHVLQFIGDERRGEAMSAELWLITAYHEYGSLYDFLKTHVITWPEVRQIGESMALGLAHLHCEQPPDKLEGLKPAVAHRDFKSKNVLMKSDMTACIADFGLAMTFYPGQQPGESHGQVGTRRYMAPEVLEGAIYFHRNAFLPIDMYACSLVLWELVSRCSSQDGPVGEYKLPYEDDVGQHPTLDDMQECVVTRKKRPAIQSNWLNHAGLASVVEMMQDGWDPDAEARISAAGIAERFALLSRQHQTTSLSSKEASL